MQPMPMQNAWILWGAFLTAQPIFAGIGVVVGGSVEGADPLLAPILMAVAAGPALGSLLWGRAVGPKAGPTIWLIRWAFAEAVGVFGLLTMLLTGSPLGLAAIACAMVLIAAQFPRQEV